MTAARRPFTAVLFDIDGTLMRNSSAHIQFLLDTIADHTGERYVFELGAENPLIDGRNVSGFTDRQLLELLVPGEEADAEALRGTIMADYPQRFASSVAAGGTAPGEIIPGAETCLRAVRRAGLATGLSTGNAAGVAWAKLDAVGLSSSFAFGPQLGFGGEWASREAVVRAAIAEVGGDHRDIALVGDTVSDMRSGTANGVAPVGVLTGAASAEQLREAGALHVLASVREFPTLL